MMEKTVEKLQDKQENIAEDVTTLRLKYHFLEQQLVNNHHRDYEVLQNYVKALETKMDNRVTTLETKVDAVTEAVNKLTLEFAKRQAVNESWLKFVYPIIAGGAGLISGTLGPYLIGLLSHNSSLSVLTLLF